MTHIHTHHPPSLPKLSLHSPRSSFVSFSSLSSVPCAWVCHTACSYMSYRFLKIQRSDVAFCIVISGRKNKTKHKRCLLSLSIYLSISLLSHFSLWFPLSDVSCLVCLSAAVFLSIKLSLLFLLLFLLSTVYHALSLSSSITKSFELLFFIFFSAET